MPVIDDIEPVPRHVARGCRARPLGDAALAMLTHRAGAVQAAPPRRCRSASSCWCVRLRGRLPADGWTLLVARRVSPWRSCGCAERRQERQRSSLPHRRADDRRLRRRRLQAADDEVRRLDALDDADVAFDLDEIAHVAGRRQPTTPTTSSNCSTTAAASSTARRRTDTRPSDDEPPPHLTTDESRQFTIPIPALDADPDRRRTGHDGAGRRRNHGHFAPHSTTDTTAPRRRRVRDRRGRRRRDRERASSRRQRRDTDRGALPYESVGMIVPAAPASVVTTYVSRGLNYGSTYDSITTVVDSELPLPRSSSDSGGDLRNRPLPLQPIAHSSPSDGDGLSAHPDRRRSVLGASRCRARRSTALVEIRVSQSDFGDTVARTIPDAVSEALRRQLAVIDDLGWQPENVSELRSYRSVTSASPAPRSALTVDRRAGEPRRSLAAPPDGGDCRDGERGRHVTTPDGDWRSPTSAAETCSCTSRQSG